MSVTAEPEGMRRHNFGIIVHKLARQMLEWRYTNPHYQMRVGMFDETPRMTELSHNDCYYWARRASQYDAERSIHMTEESSARAKNRAGEAL